MLRIQEAGYAGLNQNKRVTGDSKRRTPLFWLMYKTVVVNISQGGREKLLETTVPLRYSHSVSCSKGIPSEDVLACAH